MTPRSLINQSQRLNDIAEALTDFACLVFGMVCMYFGLLVLCAAYGGGI